MFIDSHCHLNFPELAENIEGVIATMRLNQVSHALCVSVDLAKFPEIIALTNRYPSLYASVGVHPDYELPEEPTVQTLVDLAQTPQVVAIGETGLDYFRLQGDLAWQRERFRTHIRAAKQCHKPLIIHTRSAAEDTLRIMREENAAEVGGVMHCFTEELSVALAAIELGFYISFSGIITFKKANLIKEVATRIPLNRILIETDSPYLAPVPHRGKLNQPGYVPLIAQEIATLRQISLEEVAAATTKNFNCLFNLKH
jgi:TatD DNase family protein